MSIWQTQLFENDTDNNELMHRPENVCCRIFALSPGISKEAVTLRECPESPEIGGSGNGCGDEEDAAYGAPSCMLR